MSDDTNDARLMAEAHGLTVVRGPHDVTRAFEAALCEYTGAKHAVTTTSCTMAIQIAAAWLRSRAVLPWSVCMPRFSYVGVPAAVLNAGADHVSFVDEDWAGEYQFSERFFNATGSHRRLLPLWDSARRFTSGMFRPAAMQCVSFHWGKILGLSQGGAILHDNDEADAWLRRARFDGRTEGVEAKVDQVQYPSWHAYLSPEVAAHGLMKLALLPKHNPDLPKSDYPDLSTLKAFK